MCYKAGRESAWLAICLAIGGFILSDTSAEEPFLRHGWPLQNEIPSADGEDEPVDGQFPRYFSFGETSLMFLPSGAESNTSKRVERFLGESGETERKDAASGVEWDMARVWASADGSWILWRGSQDGKPILHFVSSGSLQDAFDLPSASVSSLEDVVKIQDAAVIWNDRLYFGDKMPIPDRLQASFDQDSTLMPHETAWFDLAWHGHSALLSGMNERVADSIRAEPIDESSRKAAGVVGALLKKPPLRIVGDEIVGDWSVRSIQGAPGAHFAYPFFKARIENLDGVFFIEKTSGSQRFSGLLHRHTPTQLIFLGGSTVNDEPQVGYSGVSASGAPTPQDSFGSFYQLGKNHLILLRDVSWEGDYELLEFKRP